MLSSFSCAYWPSRLVLNKNNFPSPSLGQVLGRHEGVIHQQRKDGGTRILPMWSGGWWSGMGGEAPTPRMGCGWEQAQQTSRAPLPRS